MNTLSPQQKYALELKRNNPDGNLACLNAPCFGANNWVCIKCPLNKRNYAMDNFSENRKQAAAAFIAKYAPEPEPESTNWESAYRILFATNALHMRQLETANDIIDALSLVARKKSDEVERLRAILYCDSGISNKAAENKLRISRLRTFIHKPEGDSENPWSEE